MLHNELITILFIYFIGDYMNNDYLKSLYYQVALLINDELFAMNKIDYLKYQAAESFLLSKVN